MVNVPEMTMSGAMYSLRWAGLSCPVKSVPRKSRRAPVIRWQSQRCGIQSPTTIVIFPYRPVVERMKGGTTAATKGQRLAERDLRHHRATYIAQDV